MIIKISTLIIQSRFHLALNQFTLHHPIYLRLILFQSERKQALQAKVEAEKEGIVVPLTLEEYCLKPKTNPNNQEPQVSVDFLQFVSVVQFIDFHF